MNKETFFKRETVSIRFENGWSRWNSLLKKYQYAGKDILSDVPLRNYGFMGV
jgi:hypothetical protein